MSALIVYESMYGNTRAIAETIADELGDGAVARSVHEAGALPESVDLLVVGGPTHMHGLASKLSRSMAVHAAEEDGHASVEPSATQGSGLRTWLRDLPQRPGVRAAAFDTRGDANSALTGSAARGITRRLVRRGFDIAGSESFLVDDSEGPLADGELDRARAWARTLLA